MKYIALHNGHDSHITAFEDSKIVMHLELERFLNEKHFIGIHSNKIVEVLDALLKKLSWHYGEISTIIFCGLVPFGGDWSKTEFNEVVRKISYSKQITSPCAMWNAKWRGKPRQFIGITHHMSHMAYSYYTSPFTESLLFAIDGRGDYGINTTYGVGENNKIKYTGNTTWDNPEKIPYNNIGITYSCLGHLFPFLGLNPLSTAGKAMGLSSYGTPIDSLRDLAKLILFPKDISAYCNENEKRMWEATIKNCSIIKNSFKMDYNNPQCQDVQNLMATIQDEIELYMVNSINSLAKTYKQNSACLSGGCALNCQANTRIIKEKAIEKLWIPPACSDSGLAIGAGLYYWHHILNNPFNGCENHDPYLGDWLTGEITTPVSYTELTEDKLLDKTAYALLNGKIVAWAQGRGEIGPRALGNRSILALPYPSNIKDIINHKVKHREFWRPFAPMCLEEYASQWFEIDHAQPYMLECPVVKAEKRYLIPAVTHIDGTARLQTVNQKNNPLIYKLLKIIYEKTNIPILLNTSLNDKNKPIANNMEVIAQLFVNTDLDHAVINNKFLSKGSLKII